MNTFLSNPKHTNEKGLAHKNKYLKGPEPSRQDEKVLQEVNTQRQICSYKSVAGEKASQGEGLRANRQSWGLGQRQGDPVFWASRGLRGWTQESC